MGAVSARLALGTAQFGQRYGLAGHGTAPGLAEAGSIVDRARTAGLDTLDTAIAYGESERWLGEIGVSEWQVVTKLPPVPRDCTDVAGWVLESIGGSLSRLKVGRLRGVLLHRPMQLLEDGGAALYAALVGLKERGLTEKLGVSVYAPSELDALVPRFRLDLVQAPFNVLDRRLLLSGWLARMYESGIEVHARSVFLQGLLLMDASARPARFDRWRPLWERWRRWLAAASLTPVQGCLGFALAHAQVSRVVIGVDSLAQLEDILGFVRGAGAEPPVDLGSEDLDLIDPSRWLS